jgi:quercetin dioxygenase-like cupin family protein
MDAWEMGQLLRQQATTERPYLEFIRTPSLSAGLYVLAAGATDRQQPHTEDEVYYVASGSGQITVGSETRPADPGSTIFVAAGVPHRFHDIADELRIVVFFAPPEGSVGRESR